LRFGVWGLELKDWGLGFRVWGLGFVVRGLVFGVWNSGFRRCRVSVSGFGFRVSDFDRESERGLGFGVWDLGLRV
jgi:hypothetical protein